MIGFSRNFQDSAASIHVAKKASNVSKQLDKSSKQTDSLPKIKPCIRLFIAMYIR